HQKVYEVPITTRLNTDKPPTREGLRACPGVLGGVQWNGPAFNPGTNMLYVNSVDWCGSFNKAADVRYVEGAFYMGGGVNMDPPQKSRGWLNAVDASTGAVRWKYESSRPMLAAVTTTSANLIFTGELLGDFMALDGKTGEVLYRFNTGGRLNGGGITNAVEGKQNVSGASGAANGFWAVPPGSATIIVFGLPSDSAGGTGGNRGVAVFTHCRSNKPSGIYLVTALRQSSTGLMMKAGTSFSPFTRRVRISSGIPTAGLIGTYSSTLTTRLASRMNTLRFGVRISGQRWIARKRA